MIKISFSVIPLLMLTATNGKLSESAFGCQCYSEADTRRCSIKKAVLEEFAIFIGKHLCWSLFFNEVVGMQLY